MIQKGMVLKNIGAAGMVVALIVIGLLFTGSLVGENVDRGYLGVSVEGLSKLEMKESGITHGVVVHHVVEGEAADKAGIQEGDVILFFNGEKIRRPADLVDAVRDVSPGEIVPVQLVRNKKAKDLKVKVGIFQKKELKWFGTKSFGIPSKVYLGVRLHQMNADLAPYFKVNAKEGVLVISVEKKSPAEKAGLKSGDVITRVNEKEVASADDVRKALIDFKDGDEVKVSIVRHGKPIQVNAELAQSLWGKGVRWFQGMKHKDFEFPEFHFDYNELSEKLKDKKKKFKKKTSKKQTVTIESHSI